METGKRMMSGGLLAGILGGTLLAAGLTLSPAAHADEKVDAARAAITLSATLTPEEYEKRAEDVIGPEKFDNNCASCHALEAEAWQQTTHYATFQTRHRTDEAEKILKAMGQRSMKRAGECMHCHYTSVLQRGKATPTWGVSCESCHSPAKNWVNIHNKVGGVASGETLKWGKGKDEAPDARAKRIGAAEAAGMIHAGMIYDIARNCFSCHTVPNEEIVNKGGHKAGSDFDLVAWSQGQVRHNFVTSPGAPDNATNEPVSTERRRLYYVVGALVDYETTLRNLSNVKEKGGAFHKAMVERANKVRDRLDAIAGKVDLGDLKAAIEAAPKPMTEDTAVSADLADKLGAASKKFSQMHDGSKLAGVDPLIPTEVKGDVYNKK